MSIKKTIGLLAIALCTFTGAKAQNVAVKTNLLYDATLTVNAGIEFGLAPRWTLDVSGNYNSWNIKNRKWKHWLAQPEFRYWFCDRFAGHFLGFHALGGQYNVANIDFDFDSWKANYITDFNISPAQSTDSFLNLPPWVKRLAVRYLTKRVTMDSNCRACGKCVTHCPANAITIKRGRARVNQRLCIRCYCCQELCPFDAVRFKKPFLYRVARWLSGENKKK